MRNLKLTAIFGIVLIICLSQLSAAHWIPDDGWKMHYPQRPDPHGWDVCLRRMAIADDFKCTETGLITGIHFWISWKDNFVDEVLRWDLCIYSDEDGRPGELLWKFRDGEISIRVEEPSMQGWLCPCWKNDPNRVEPENHTWYALVNITEIKEPFDQEEGEVYWLVLRANATVYESPRPQPEVGWKTSVDEWGKPALWRPWPISVSDGWKPVVSPDGTSNKPHNMAFVINGKEQPPVELDFGDVEETRCEDANSRCNSYPTTLGRNGARHIIDQHIFLGPPYTGAEHNIDAEPDGQPCHYARGDDMNGIDDEDGVFFEEMPLIPGTTSTLVVLASAEGFLDGWIDFEGDGDWDDLGDRIFFSAPLEVGENELTFEVPHTSNSGEAKDTYARFRYSTRGHLPYFGLARDGEVEDYFVTIGPDPHPRLDYGDAPDGWEVEGYPTLRIHDGARHKVNPRVRLGRYIDVEGDGQPTIHADGDDLNHIDDEDGVFFASPIIPGHTAKVKVIASTRGFLNAWIDFDGNRDWDGADEQIFDNEPLRAGVNYLKFEVPAASHVAVDMKTYSRFRFSTDTTNTGYTGLARDGEVEDYMVKIEVPEPAFDFGDAPEIDSNDPTGVHPTEYPTTLERDGARHVAREEIYLGRAIDTEWDGQPTMGADGDDLDASVDDEDGVKFVTPLIPGLMAKVAIVASAEGYIDAWIDFNADGDWDDYKEQIFARAKVRAGVNYLKFEVPPYPYAVAAEVKTYGRFRYSTYGGLKYGGPAKDGEVEDYLVKIEEPPQQAADLGDAPDSSNNFNVGMSAYPSVGMLPVVVPADFPTVYKTGSPPWGPIHWHPELVAHLGAKVSQETEADFGYDEDPTNNIIPRIDRANMDKGDDGVRVPLVLPHCRPTKFSYVVSVVHPIDELYVNVWFDWNRDGDWDDVMRCPLANDVADNDRGLAREWAVRNQVLRDLDAGIHRISTPWFVPHHPFITDDDVVHVDPIWMRITLSERPWGPVVASAAGGWGGSGPRQGYKIGETEDYYFVPKVKRVEHADLDCDEVVNFKDFALFASQWLSNSE